MQKDLKSMSLEELWELFPIFLTPHQPCWKQWADEEIYYLGHLLADYNPIINHIGSTAVPGIQAKPIIDILVELPAESINSDLCRRMEEVGYICMAATGARMSFNKGYTPQGYAEKVFHIHFHPYGDNDEIRFRDYLLNNPDAAKEYEALKLRLADIYRNDRDAYTEAKSPFIKSTLQLI